jgi:hypothetical protein
MENLYLQLGETTQEQIFAHMLSNEVLFRKCKNQLSFKYFTNPDLSVLVKIAFEIFAETQTTPTVEMIRAKINASYFGADVSRRLRILFDNIIASRDDKALPVIISELRIWKIAIISKDRCLEIINAHNGKRYNSIPDLFRQSVFSIDAIDFDIEEPKAEIKIEEKNVNQQLSLVIEYLISKARVLTPKQREDLKQIQLNFKISSLTEIDQQNLKEIIAVVHAINNKEKSK